MAKLFIYVNDNDSLKIMKVDIQSYHLNEIRSILLCSFYNRKRLYNYQFLFIIINKVEKNFIFTVYF